MAEVRAAIDISAPRDAVWDVVTDLSRLGEWVTVHDGFEGSPPRSVEPGTRFTQKLSVAGKDFKVHWTATEISEREVLEWEGEGPAGSTARTRYELSGDDGRTNFNYISDVDPPAGKLGDAAASVVGRSADDEAEQTLQRLKRLVEG